MLSSGSKVISYFISPLHNVRIENFDPFHHEYLETSGRISTHYLCSRFLTQFRMRFKYWILCMDLFSLRENKKCTLKGCSRTVQKIPY